MADLEAAKRRLSDVLSDNMQKYWTLMKSWYRRKITKESFDSKAKTLLGESNVHLHNEFLFAILVKCQTGDHPDAPQPVTAAAPFPVPPVPVPTAAAASPPPAIVSKASPPPPPSVGSGRPKLKKQRRFSPPAEIPYGALDVLQYHVPPKVQITGRDLDSIMLCAHDLMLPDFPTLHTRMLLLAWEAGLDRVSEESAKLLLLSLQWHLKNVIQTLIAHQTSWRSKKGGQFQHSFGSESLSSSEALTSPSSTNTASTLTNVLVGSADQPLPSSAASDEGELSARVSMGDEDSAGGQGEISSPAPHQSSSDEPSELQGSVQPVSASVKSVSEAELAMVASKAAMTRRLEPLTLFHLRDALLMNRHCIPVHSVYACNMERISAMMWHPSREEEEQQRTVEQWKNSLQTKPPLTITTLTAPLNFR